jgi:hypothetical protein
MGSATNLINVVASLREAISLNVEEIASSG